MLLDDATTPTTSDNSPAAPERRSEPRKSRKRSKRTKGLCANPAAAQRLKELWATPEFREKMKQRDQARIALAKLSPTKYNRYGVPDGMRRAKAEPLWAKARLLADRFIQILKEKGELPDHGEVAHRYHR